jgi:hypothetical protein
MMTMCAVSRATTRCSAILNAFGSHCSPDSRGGLVKFAARRQREVRRIELKPKTIAVETWEHVQMSVKNLLACRFTIGQE